MEVLSDIFKNYSAYIIGIPSILASIFIAYWIVKKQHEYKAISYMIDSYYDLISKSLKESGLQLFHKEKEYKNAALLILEIKNNGVLPIEPRDFIKNLQLIFSDKSEILDIEIIKKYPDNLEIEYVRKENVVEFTPFLLNKDENFKVKLLIGNNKNFDVRARISGVTEIEKIKPYDGIEGYKYFFSNYKKSFFKYIVIMALPFSSLTYLYLLYLDELFNNNFFIRFIFILIIFSIISNVADKLFDHWIQKQHQENKEEGNSENEANK